MEQTTRRDVLRRSGTGAIATGALIGTVGTATAGWCDCDIGDCNDVCGDIIEVKELTGNGTARYELYSAHAQFLDCFPDTYESNDYIKNSTDSKFGGTVSDGSDKVLISGGGLTEIRVCDVDDPGAKFAIELTRCPDHCASDYTDYASVAVSNLSSDDSGSPLCSEWGDGKAYYDFCVSSDLENGDIDGEDTGEYWGNCAEGYLPNGDLDGYDTWGRIIDFYAEPNGGNVYLRRSAEDNC